MMFEEEELSEIIQHYTSILDDAGIGLSYDENSLGFVHYLLNGMWQGNNIARILTLGMIHQRLSDARLVDIQDERNFIYNIMNRDDKPYMKDTPPMPDVGDENESLALRRIISDLENKLESAHTRIGSLTLERDDLKDTHVKRKQWLDRAKRDAGFSTSESFDKVWSKVLESYKTDVSQEN